VKHEDAVRWITKYAEGDPSYPYLAMKWYEDERKKRPLSADEQKTVLWLKENYGIEARLQKLPLQPRDWCKRNV
jgi:hypothetical protein